MGKHMTSDVKLLPLPFSPYLICDWAGPSSGYTRTWPAYTPEQMEAYARACIEADRKARESGGEAVAWRRRHPSEDDPSGWHGWIVSDKKPRQEIAGSEYQPLYTHPAPDDVARLVEALRGVLRVGRGVSGRLILEREDEAPIVEALAPFTATQQEVRS